VPYSPPQEYSAPQVSSEPPKEEVTYQAPSVPELPPPVYESPSQAEKSEGSGGICNKCNKEIKGPCFNAIGCKFHGECFVCATGSHSLAPSWEYHIYEDKVYCPPHYLKCFEKACAGCGETIKDDFVQAADKYYHPGCWKCAGCENVLTADSHGIYMKQFYCNPCYRKWVDQDDDLKAKEAHEKLQARLAAMKAKKKEPEKKAARMWKPGDAISFADLKSGKDLPDNIDKGNKEIYLSDAEFQQYLKMDRGAFTSTPKWKRDKIKKELGIY